MSTSYIPAALSQDGRITPLTPEGRVTVRLLQLNEPMRVEERELLFAAGEINFPNDVS